MSGESDDDLMMPTHTTSKSRIKPPTKRPAIVFDMDALIAESETEVRRAERLPEEVTAEDLDAIMTREYDTHDRVKRIGDAMERCEVERETVMRDKSIKIPGAIKVFVPLQGKATVDLSFRAPRPRKELGVLFDALRRAANDPVDLEGLLGGLVMWVRQKVDGKAPPEVCRFLLRVVSRHAVSAVVRAAKEALLELLAESSKVWKLRYRDTLDVWRGCGAVWLSEGGDADDDGDIGEDEDDGDEINQCLWRNLGPTLDIVKACLRSGAHEMNDDELREMLLDLSAAFLDKEVCGSCQTELFGTLTAVVDAMSLEFYQNMEAGSSLVDALCEPSVLSRRRLRSRVEPLSSIILARNVPYNRLGAKGLSLRHEVCHRLLTGVLGDTSYPTEESLEGLDRSIKALQVLLDNEDDLMEDDSFEGYQRQYMVVALANEMAAGALAVSQNGRPNQEQSEKIVVLVSGIYRELRDIMQSYVQQTKILLDGMKTKYTAFLPSSASRQTKLWAHAEIQEEDGRSASEEEDSEEEDDDRAESQ